MKHPQNGPSLSKAPDKKRKQRTEEEEAEYHARKAGWQAQVELDAAESRETLTRLRKEGVSFLKELRRSRKGE
jgi:hypothetical protein